MFRYILFILTLCLLLSCDNRNPSDPDYIFEEVFAEYFDQIGDWFLDAEFSPAFGDTAWSLVDDGLLQMGALYGSDVPSASAYYEFSDSLTQVWFEKNAFVEIKVVSAGVSEVGDVTCHLFFNNELVDISFDSFGLFDYSNYILQIDYEEEYNIITILVNGVELTNYQINDPGGLFRLLFNLWTSNPNDNGSALLKVDYVKISTYWEEE